MKLFRRLSLLILLGCFANLFVMGYLSVRVSVFFWPLVIAQALACYAGSEIVHTMYKKPKMPHPTSLAFQKEVLNRYNV
jgi:hypothetical protein